MGYEPRGTSSRGSESREAQRDRRDQRESRERSERNRERREQQQRAAAAAQRVRELEARRAAARKAELERQARARASAQREREQAARREAARKAERERQARERESRERAAREKAAREKAAREKAAREKAAREKVEREAREKAARQARSEARALRGEALAEARSQKQHAGDMGFQGGNDNDTKFGRLSQLEGPATMGSGVLAGMGSLSAPTTAQQQMGVTNEVYNGLHDGATVTDDDMREAITSADQKIKGDIVEGFGKTALNTVAPGLMSTPGVSQLVNAGIDAWRSDPTAEEIAERDALGATLAPNIHMAEYNQNHKKDELTDAVYDSMRGESFIGAATDAAGVASGFGAIKGNSFAQDVAPILNNPVTNIFSDVIDPAYGSSSWREENADELDRLGVDLSSSNQRPDRGGNDNNHQRPSTGILGGMTPPKQPEAQQPTIAQQPGAVAGVGRPDFSWVTGRHFNSNYKMGYRR